MAGGEGMGAGSLPALVLGVILAIKCMKSASFATLPQIVVLFAERGCLQSGLDWAPLLEVWDRWPFL